MDAIKTALVLNCKTERYCKEWKAAVEKEGLPVKYIFVCSRVDQTRTLFVILQECCDLIEKHGIDIVVSTDDKSFLVHSAITEKHPHIKGSSFEGAFLCFHKLFTREMVVSKLEHANLKFGSWGRSSELKLQRFNDSPTNTKFITKPYFGTASMGLNIFNHRNELLEFLGTESTNQTNSNSLPAIAQFLQMNLKVPYCLDDGVLIEEYIEQNTTNEVAFIGADSAYTQKQLVPWALYENIYWPNNKTEFIGLALPTSLSMEMQNKVWSTMEALAQILNKYGYDDQLFGAEFIVYGDNVKVMEINGRLTPQLVQVYRGIFENGDKIKAGVEIGLGKIPQQPISKLGDKYCLSAYIPVSSYGTTGDMVNYQIADTHPEILLFFDEDHYLDGERGPACLGYVTMVGDSLYDCMTKVANIVRNIAKPQLETPWLDGQCMENINLADETLLVGQQIDNINLEETTTSVEPQIVDITVEDAASLVEQQIDNLNLAVPTTLSLKDRVPKLVSLVGQQINNLNLAVATSLVGQHIDNLNSADAASLVGQQIDNLNLEVATSLVGQQIDNLNSADATSLIGQQIDNLNLAVTTSLVGQQIDNLNSADATSLVGQQIDNVNLEDATSLVGEYIDNINLEGATALIGQQMDNLNLKGATSLVEQLMDTIKMEDATSLVEQQMDNLKDATLLVGQQIVDINLQDAAALVGQLIENIKS